MNDHVPRRRFLQSASALGLGAGLGTWEMLRGITPAAEETRVGPEAVKLRPEIEPVVRWMEDVPRERAFEKAVAELKNGLSYRELVAGLFLAGIRNVQPRPVGYKFHAVLVINSAHLLGQSAPFSERLLPMFWALDNFKSAQARDVEEGDWALGPVDEARVPPPHRAKDDFVKAMEGWDVDGADVAAAGLCRASGAAEAMEPFWRMAARDQRDIGHKAIFAAQSWRTLQTIGWEHAEPVLRSLAYAMLDLQGDRPGPIGPYEANLENVKKVRDEWQIGRADPGATRSLLETIRQASPEEASAEAAKLLNDGVAPGSLWDAVFLASSEMMMRSPGIISLHATTAANALHFMYKASGDDANRKLALLQAVGWMPLYRARNKSPQPIRIDDLGDDAPISTNDEAVAEIFQTNGDDHGLAAAKAMGFLARGGSRKVLFDAAARMIFHKGTNSHDYKYGAAIWEECALAGDPKWQPHLAAASLYNLPGTAKQDSPLMIRAREAVASVMG